MVMYGKLSCVNMISVFKKMPALEIYSNSIPFSLGLPNFLFNIMPKPHIEYYIFKHREPARTHNIKLL